MKALFALLFANAAFAGAFNCRIPDEYAIQDGSGGCGGARAPYRIFGYCVTGLDKVAFPAAVSIRSELTSSTLGQFSSAAPADQRGCVAISPGVAWVAGMGTIQSLGGGTGCPMTTPTWGPANAGIKGIEIMCADGYYPTSGVPGSMVCLPGTTNAPPFLAPVPATLDYFGSGLLEPVVGTSYAAAGVTRFSAPDQLICTRGCALPLSVCRSGRISDNVILSGDVIISDCNVRPTSAVRPASVSLRCAVAPFSMTWNFTCTASGVSTENATLSSNPTYGFECGGLFGAQIVQLTQLNFGIPQVQGPGQIQNFPTVTSTLGQGIRTTTGYVNIWDASRRWWNNNPATPLAPAVTLNISVMGCESLPDPTQCVQHTLNWWRCHFDIPFNGGSLCFANGALIACPTHGTGFRCPSSSKKGLLGLLGLLGIIPIVAALLCCCLICMMRRRKTAGDVHFATFGTPHAGTALAPGMHSIIAPSIIAGGPPTGMPIPLGYGHTPGL